MSGHDGVPAHGAEPRTTVKGAVALFVLRLLDLPLGEYVIHLDKSHPHRMRWRVAPVGAWERQRHEQADGIAQPIAPEEQKC